MGFNFDPSFWENFKMPEKSQDQHAKDYRENLKHGRDNTASAKALGIGGPIEHTQGYSNPGQHVAQPTRQLPTAPQGGIQPVKPVSKGMDYLQSIQPRAPAGGNSGGGSTLMSQALRSQGSSGGGTNG